ncbi:hypothetical protein MXB_334 [Myxobolus squamalis]|nr:hypothetical protein MXB_334 [Myxobolus squamalis]
MSKFLIDCLIKNRQLRQQLTREIMRIDHEIENLKQEKSTDDKPVKNLNYFDLKVIPIFISQE